MPSTAAYIHKVILAAAPYYQHAKADRQATNLYFVISRIVVPIRRLITKINHLSVNEKIVEKEKEYARACFKTIAENILCCQLSQMQLKIFICYSPNTPHYNYFNLEVNDFQDIYDDSHCEKLPIKFCKS
jgi:hypothetical protein